MSVTIEYVRAMLDLEDVSRPVLDGASLTLEQKQAYYHIILHASELAAQLCEASYSEAYDSDYQFLCRNAFFRRNIALAKSTCEMRAKETDGKTAAQVESYHEKTGTMVASEETIRFGYLTKNLGLEQLSRDPAFRALLTASEPSLLQRLDASVIADQNKPAFLTMDAEQRKEFVSQLVALPSFKQAKAGLAFKFLRAVAPDFIAKAMVFGFDTKEQKAATELLAKLKSRTPATPAP